MCVVAIVDADVLPVLASREGAGDSLFLSWIKRRHGLLAFPTTGQYFTELRRNRAVMELIRRYDQGGQLKKISKSEVSEAGEQVYGKRRRSNDSHVLALALASGATVLCSNDGRLRADFKDKSILPAIGRRPRILYPFGGSRKQRRQFLDRQRCPDREQDWRLFGPTRW